MSAIMTIEFEKIVTDHGLNIPGDISEEDLFKIADTLVKIELGTQWAIGDWYNAFRWGDKKEACERVGLNYQNAVKCANVAKAFEMRLRGRISFKHHKTLSISDLSPGQRNDLLEQSEDNKWSVKKLTEERDKVLGIWIEPMPKPEGLDEIIDSTIEDVPDRYKTRCKKAMNTAKSRLVKDFNKVVHARVKDRVKESWEDAEQAKVKAEEEYESWAKGILNINHILTLKEFQAIRSALHPDKHPPEDKAMYDKLFKIFNKLKDNVDKNPKSKWVDD